jgi:hypothetical protein
MILQVNAPAFRNGDGVKTLRADGDVEVLDRDAAGGEDSEAASDDEPEQQFQYGCHQLA